MCEGKVSVSDYITLHSDAFGHSNNFQQNKAICSETLNSISFALYDMSEKESRYTRFCHRKLIRVLFAIFEQAYHNGWST